MINYYQFNDMSKFKLTPEASREIVRVFGGQKETGELLGLKQPMISRYCRIGFPYLHALALQSLLPKEYVKRIFVTNNKIFFD